MPKLLAKLKQQETAAIDLHAHFQRTYENLRIIDATRSPWAVHDKARSIMAKNHEARKNYQAAIIHGSSVIHIRFMLSLILV